MIISTHSTLCAFVPRNCRTVQTVFETSKNVIVTHYSNTSITTDYFTWSLSTTIKDKESHYSETEGVKLWFIAVYHTERSVLLENTQVIKFMKKLHLGAEWGIYICAWLVRILMKSIPTFSAAIVLKHIIWHFSCQISIVNTLTMVIRWSKCVLSNTPSRWKYNKVCDSSSWS